MNRKENVPQEIGDNEILRRDAIERRVSAREI
jgi:hypothetical protein